jgi:hypothetical protein
MTRRQVRGWSLIGACLVLVLAARASGQTYFLKAVAINGEPIEPTSQVSAEPGNIIVCEIYGDWSPVVTRLKSWQVQIDGSDFGSLLPIMPAYCDNLTDVSCTSDADCFGEQICWWPEGPNGFCAGPNHHPEDGAYIDSLRPDYAFAPAGSPPPEFKAVDMSTLSFRYASTVLHLDPAYVPPPKYFATFTLEVLPDACALFTVEFLRSPASFFVNSAGQCFFPVDEGLEIDAGPCVPQAVTPFPPNCAIDARQPSQPDGSGPAGWDSMTFHFEECELPGHPCDLSHLGPDSFSVREEPSGGAALGIAEVTHTDDSVTVALDRRIGLQRWTCIQYAPSVEESCIAHLPGDVNGDGRATPADILRLIDCLNGVASCEEWQCDVDRSGVCGPPDVLRVIDLLNGAGVYEPWLNRGLPPCPSAP